MKIWTCYDNLKAQKWFYTNDNRIALENQGLSVFSLSLVKLYLLERYSRFLPRLAKR